MSTKPFIDSKPNKYVQILYITNHLLKQAGLIFLRGLLEGGKMNYKLGERIKKQIRKRAFEQSDRQQQERLNLQDVEHTLDALHEVTGLPRAELKTIADEAMLSFNLRTEKFFSVKNQILIASSACSCAIFLAWLLL